MPLTVNLPLLLVAPEITGGRRRRHDDRRTVVAALVSQTAEDCVAESGWLPATSATWIDHAPPLPTVAVPITVEPSKSVIVSPTMPVPLTVYWPGLTLTYLAIHRRCRRHGHGDDRTARSPRS